MSFELQPLLRGELLELRPLAPGDFDSLYAVAKDPLLWELHPANDRHQEPVFRAFFQQALDSGGAFLILDRADGRVVGSSRYHGLDEALSQVEIGWTFLARSHWGGRHNRELKTLMLDHAFRFVTRVHFHVGENNHRSRRAMEKIGGTLVGTRDDGGGRRSFIFRITRDEHEALTRSSSPRPSRSR